jgi:hypothetical protein
LRALEAIGSPRARQIAIEHLIELLPSFALHSDVTDTAHPGFWLGALSPRDQTRATQMLGDASTYLSSISEALRDISLLAIPSTVETP